MICLKIRTFVVSATTCPLNWGRNSLLWFAWKFVPLWYQQQRLNIASMVSCRCDLLENSYLCGISNNIIFKILTIDKLWFAWKFVPLWYQQQQREVINALNIGCDLLENSYLCGISNNHTSIIFKITGVVICLKIRTFVVSATTQTIRVIYQRRLWFAWKFVPLWYQQQQKALSLHLLIVVICLKIRTFVVSATTSI